MYFDGKPSTAEKSIIDATPSCEFKTFPIISGAQRFSWSSKTLGAAPPLPCRAAPSVYPLRAPGIRNLIKTVEKQEKYRRELNEFERMTEEGAREQGEPSPQYGGSIGTSSAADGRTPRLLLD